MPPASARLSWTLIVLAVASMVAAPYLFVPEGEQDSTATLVILKLQSRMLTGMAQLAPAQVSEQVGQLEDFVGTPDTARAIAAVNLYIGGEEGRDRAFLLLDAYDSPEELHELVRTAIETPQAISPPERERILEEMGWFGQLLLAHDRPSDDPLRKEIRAASFRALVVVGLLIVGGGTAVLAGFVLAIVALVARAKGELAGRFKPGSPYDPIYLQAFAVYLTLMLIAQIGLPMTGVTAVAPSIVGLVIASLVGLCWPVLRGVPRETAFRELGLHRGAGFLKEALSGLAGYVTILPLVALGFVTTLVLIAASEILLPADPDAPPQMISHPVAVWMAHGSAAMRVGILMLASGFAPFFEEALFRGALYRSLRARLGVPVSLPVMAFIFAAIHPQGLLLVPALGALAVGFGLIYEWRGSLVGPMAAHAVHNGTLILFMWIMLG